MKNKPNYLYSKNEFIPNKTPIYYSGPYWDEKELESAVEVLMGGKWLASGENVHKFEKKFSKYLGSEFSNPSTSFQITTSVAFME